MDADTDTVSEVVQTGLTLASVINHLKNNRIEYAVFTLLAYTVGLLDKAISYGADICV